MKKTTGRPKSGNRDLATASATAASVVERTIYGWNTDPAAGCELNPWDGDIPWHERHPLMAVPEWMIPLMQQFPIIRIVIGGAWFLLRRSVAQWDCDRARAKSKRTTRHAVRTRKSQERKTRPIARQERTTRYFDGQVARLQARIDDGDYR